jgi:SAM-dependent methyltransferase
MNSHPRSDRDDTVRYYDQNSRAFIVRSRGLDMASLYRPFLACIPPGGHILDAGCGSGRDARAFLDRGYLVTALDASEAMVAEAADFIGQRVLLMRFQEIAFEDEFDGVWACASLLHVPRAEMDAVLARIVRALKPEGLLYLSFKEGQQDRIADGRFFSDYTEGSLTALLARQSALELLQVWTTRGQDVNWINGLARKPAV